MNHSIEKLFVAAFTVVTAAAFAAPAGDTIHGRVRAVRDGSVQVCFYNGYMPVAGADFALLRNVTVAAPKSQSPIRRADVGAIRLSGSVEQGCASAKVVRGEAKTADWVVASQAGTR